MSFTECTQSQYSFCTKQDNTNRVYKGTVQMSCSTLDAYPVGSVYLTLSATYPSDVTGGAWVRMDEGFLFSSSSLDDFTFRTDGIAISTNTGHAVPVYAWHRTA